VGVFVTGVVKTVNVRDGKEGRQYYAAIVSTGDGRVKVPCKETTFYTGERVALEGNFVKTQFGDLEFEMDTRHTADTLASVLGLAAAKPAPVAPPTAPTAQAGNGAKVTA
jgi:hypothetical protein